MRDRTGRDGRDGAGAAARATVSLAAVALALSAACGIPSVNGGPGGGGTCPCTVGNSGLQFTVGCGQHACYDLNGVAHGVYCTESGPQDDPAACNASPGTDSGATSPDGGTSTPSPWRDTRSLCNPAGPDQPDPRGTDCDADGVPDAADDCPGVPNADQADANHDGVGDACEAAFANCQLFTQVPFVPRSYAGMDLRGCAIAPVLAGAPDAGAPLDFRGANLTCAAMEATGAWNADFTNATMSRFNAYVNVSGAGPSFSGAQLDDACFDGIADVAFDGTKLTGAWLRITGSGGTTFTGTDLTNATLFQMSGVKLKSSTVTNMQCVEAGFACAGPLTGTASSSCTMALAQAAACP